VKLSDTVDETGTDDTQVSHSNFLDVAFFDDGHLLELGRIIWVFKGDAVHESLVDAENELQVSWEQVAD
jgi:hypothetical protein